jgi:two-component system response regulator DctR
MTKDVPPSAIPHIAIIDDDAAVRHSTGMLMETKSYTYVEFERGTDFFKTAKPSDFSCLIIDIRMPNMSGIELFDELIQRSIKEHTYMPPVIFISGHGDIPMAVKVLHLGAADFLEKPVDHRTLIDAVDVSIKSDILRRATFMSQYELREEIAKLTHREREVLTEIISGFLSKQIGEHLNISTKTVEAHRLRICQKFHTRTSMELAAKLRDVPESCWKIDKNKSTKANRLSSDY